MWIVFALLASSLYATTMIIDKISVSRYSSQEQGGFELVLITGLSSILPISILSFTISHEVVFPAIWWLIFSGVCFGLAMIPYIIALRGHDVMRAVIILLVSMPFLSYLVGIVFFDEYFSLLKFVLGFLCVACGFVFVRIGHTFTQSRGRLRLFLFCVMAGALWVCSSLGFRKGTQLGYGYWDAVFWEYLGMLTMTCCLFALPTFRRAWTSLFAHKRLLGVQVFNEILGTSATLLIDVALLLAPIASVSLVTNISQPLFVFVLSIAASLLLPSIHFEDLEKKILLKKVSVLMLTSTCIGLFLIAK